MQKPPSNLTPEAQEWARYMEQRDVEQQREIDNLTTLVQRLSGGDGSQAGVNASFQQAIDKNQYEIQRLYQLTGQTYPPAPPAPPTPTPPAPTYTTVTIGADWSRTWGSSSFYTGGGTDTNGTYLYQGSSPENKIGMWHFPMASIQGKNITGADMFIANINTPYQGSVTAGFGTHGNVSPPSGKPGRQNGFDVGWGRGQASWFALPSWTYGGLSNGSIQGFTVGGIGASNPNYAYFQGVGQAAPPVLRVTYQN